MFYSTSKKFCWLDGLRCLGMLGLTGLMDFVTGYDVSFFLFYLVPIIFTLRRLGRLFAFGMCVLSILTWLITNTDGETTHVGWQSPFWATTLRFLIFVLAVSLLSVREKLEKQVRRHKDVMVAEKHARHRLEQEVLEASEREQQKIGNDLHDNLCQQLTATALAGKVLANQLKAQSRMEAETADNLATMLERAIELTRTLSRSLRPITMREEGLVDGLRELAASVNDGRNVSCTLECHQTVSLGTGEANMHLYRIAQEAVNSAARLGQAKNIVIELKVEGGQIILTVLDDGVGLSSDAWVKDGLGRQIMSYRAGMINAALQVELLPQGGTRVTCRLPDSNGIFSRVHG